MAAYFAIFVPLGSFYAQQAHHGPTLTYMRITLLPLAALALGMLAGCAEKKDFKTKDGYPYVLDVHKDGGRQAKPGDLLTFHVTYRTEKDSVLGSTHSQGAPYTIPLDTAKKVGTPKDPFLSCYLVLAQGDSARFEVPSDTLFKGAPAGSRPKFLPPGSKLKIGIQALRIESVTERDARIAKELTDIAAKGGFESKSGVFIKVDRPGTGPVGTTGDTVTVHYTGRFADSLMGKKPFDSSVNPPQPGRPSEPYKVVLNSHSVISGWDSALVNLAEGSKAQVLIPHALGYGVQGSPNGIPPYSNLQFELEILKVAKAKPVAAAAPAKGKK